MLLFEVLTYDSAKSYSMYTKETLLLLSAGGFDISFFATHMIKIDVPCNVSSEVINVFHSNECVFTDA